MIYTDRSASAGCGRTWGTVRMIHRCELVETKEVILLALGTSTCSQRSCSMLDWSTLILLRMRAMYLDNLRAHRVPRKDFTAVHASSLIRCNMSLLQREYMITGKFCTSTYISCTRGLSMQSVVQRRCTSRDHGPWPYCSTNDTTTRPEYSANQHSTTVPTRILYVYY